MTPSEILEFERQWWAHLGSREQAIRDQFGMTLTQYSQRLNAIIDTPEALAIDPLTVKRLRRLRDQRMARAGATVRIQP